ncbi:hypothetical protein [Acidocella sp. C78]|uniref:hypothetical protein n=1 Tax=Acidocella sp. C78 TaxID=1671486 RepID=UPI00191BA125|nr:hypothetical protein [Acidocella sp. C78]
MQKMHGGFGPLPGKSALVRSLRFWLGVAVAASALAPGLARAQGAERAVRSGGHVELVTIQKIGLPLSPLSVQQMSSATAQGIPSVAPSLSAQSKGGNGVLLWDEVVPGRISAPNPISDGNVSLNIVH